MSHTSSTGPCDVVLRVALLKPDACTPTRATADAAGYDLSSVEDVVVPARGRRLIMTGLTILVPPGHYGRIAPRSGLACRHGIDVGAGVIDADYRGQVGVILFNHDDQDFAVCVGDRIAQLILEKISTPEVVVVAEANDTTERGSGGFGHTGIVAIH